MKKYKEKFLFDHIPKTAGTSLDDAFIRIFPGYKKSDLISNSHRALINSMENFTGGHVYYFSGERLADEVYYSTVLRDPIQRFISQYYFNRQIGEALLKAGDIADVRLTDLQVLSAMRLSIDEYVKLDGPVRRSFSNCQARHFADRVVDSIDDLIEKDLLDAAIASLEGYDLVGSFDDLQAFVDAIARDFNIESVHIARLNVTRDRPEHKMISKCTLEALNEANRVDSLLIQWARQRFSWGTEAIKLTGDLVDRVKARALHGAALESERAEENYCSGGGIRIVNATCRGVKSGVMVVELGEEIEVNCKIIAKILEQDLTIGIAISDQYGKVLYGVNSVLLANKFSIDKPGIYNSIISLENHLNSGGYKVTLALHKGRSHTDGCYHWLDDATAFIVAPAGVQPFEGVVDLRASIALSEGEPADA